MEQHVVDGRIRAPVRGLRREMPTRDPPAGRWSRRAGGGGGTRGPEMRFPPLATRRPAPIDQADIDAFVVLLLAGTTSAALAEHVLSLTGRGLALDAVSLGLLQPAARQIGTLWNEDRCSFVDVTLAVGRLQMLLRMLEPRFDRTRDTPAARREALFLTSPGDQHSFGLAMVTQVFRRAGWDVWTRPLPAAGPLRLALARRNFTVVGFSASEDRRLDAVAAAIRAVRRAAQDRAIGVLAGGPLFAQHPHLADQVGADYVGRDAAEALRAAEALAAAAAEP